MDEDVYARSAAKEHELENVKNKGNLCFAVACSHRFNPYYRSKGISFHRFPNREKFPDLYDKWVKLCGRDQAPGNHATLCSEHFTTDDINRTGQTVRLREGVIPSIFNYSVPQEPSRSFKKKLHPDFLKNLFTVFGANSSILTSPTLPQDDDSVDSSSIEPGIEELEDSGDNSFAGIGESLDQIDTEEEWFDVGLTLMNKSCLTTDGSAHTDPKDRRKDKASCESDESAVQNENGGPYFVIDELSIVSLDSLETESSSETENYEESFQEMDEPSLNEVQILDEKGFKNFDESPEMEGHGELYDSSVETGSHGIDESCLEAVRIECSTPKLVELLQGIRKPNAQIEEAKVFEDRPPAIVEPLDHEMPLEDSEFNLPSTSVGPQKNVQGKMPGEQSAALADSTRQNTSVLPQDRHLLQRIKFLHNYAAESDRTLKKKIELYEEKTEDLEKQLKNSLAREKRAKMIIATNRQQKSTQVARNKIVKNDFGIPPELCKTPGRSCYTKTQKEFALNLHSLSHDAYNFLKTKMTLPTHKTLKRWQAEKNAAASKVADSNLYIPLDGLLFDPQQLMAFPVEQVTAWQEVELSSLGLIGNAGPSTEVAALEQVVPTSEQLDAEVPSGDIVIKGNESMEETLSEEVTPMQLFSTEKAVPQMQQGIPTDREISRVKTKNTKVLQTLADRNCLMNIVQRENMKKPNTGHKSSMEFAVTDKENMNPVQEEEPCVFFSDDTMVLFPELLSDSQSSDLLNDEVSAQDMVFKINQKW